MTKFLLSILVGLMSATLIMAYGPARTDTRACGGHGDPCQTVNQCCSGMICNSQARRCMVQITSAELQTQYQKITGNRKIAEPVAACRREGDSCQSPNQCCNGMRCNSQFGKCQVPMTPQQLEEHRQKIFSKGRTPGACGKHGDSCATVGGCCDGFSCNAYAGKCMATITPEDLQAQYAKIAAKSQNRNQNAAYAA